MNLRECIWRLSLAPGFGPASINKVLVVLGVADTSMPVENERVRARLTELAGTKHKSLLLRQLSLPEKIAGAVEHVLEDHVSYQRDLEKVARAGACVITIADAEYPAILRSIYLPPAILYTMGSSLAQSTERALAVVGSRGAGDYAQRVISVFVPDLVRAGYTIVSGGALGADTMAHRATLTSHGVTIAVLGSGLGKPYPAQNKKLFREIIDAGGVIVSPFSFATAALPGNFPARNRIIAGLSAGCLLVQAAIKSGARITAQCALEQGKSVWAVPGSIFDPLSSGCHALIAEGAIPVSSAQDLFMSLSGGLQEMYQVPVVARQTVSQSVVDCVEEKLCTTRASSRELPILDALGEQRSLDELATLLDMPADQLYDELFSLQLAGRVRQNFIGNWERTKF